MRRARWIALLAAVVGVILLASTPRQFAWARESDRIQHGPSAVGFVVAARVRDVGVRHPHHDTDYDVSFTNPNGGHQERATVTRAFINDPDAKGRLVQVSFDPADPSHAELTGHPMHTRRGAWEVVGAGLAFAVAGGLGWWWLGRRLAYRKG